MVVQHNISAMNANRLFGINNSGLSKSLEKLSSGYAINRAGDNAAGLAVSEKMRAQISGLTQASKNAEDGISMVQTFEGALTETDSILQRMRTLAVQSANGTYQNDVDREAIQLEYDQLNDELNQIADTDFNGVVVLNGGQMADGLKAVDGEFNYANKAGQLADANAKALEAAQKDAQAAIDIAQKKYGEALTEFNSTKFDLSSNGTASEWNTVDNSKYGKAEAADLWDDLGLTGDPTNGDSDATKVDVTFEVDADGNWTVKSATSNASDKATFTDAALTTAAQNITAPAEANGDANTTGMGGFTWNNVNAVVDTSNFKAGDTITLTFTNETPATKAPANVGFVADSVEVDVTIPKTAGNKIAAPTVAIGNLTDADMTENTKAVIDALQGMDISAAYTSGDSAKTASSVKLNGQTVGGGSPITLQDENGNALKDSEGNDLKVYVANTNGTVVISTDNNGTAGKTLATVTFGQSADNDDVGTASAKLAFESYDYELSDSAYTVRAGDDANLGSSTEAKAKLDAAKKVLDDAKAAYPNTIEDIADKGVSKSDSNDASTATLTYKENITLQTGARTKDSVNFTFSYESRGLGDLEANLDCSARGLGTDKLSLSTQEDANAAIDKIDNAINKVSMVRASFGAMQNRLEHKIANLDVNTENLTAAESRIRDTDMASEMTNFTKNQILSQASQAMLAQANQLPQGVLQLLG